MTVCGTLEHTWEVTHAALHGQYSSKRLQQFRDYCRHASLLRVLAVLFLTPVPCIAVVVLTDAIPMEAPEKGLAGSFTFWVRLFIAVGFISGGAMEQFRTTISTLPVGKWHAVGLSVIDAAVTAGSGLAIASVIGFPIPFTIAVTSVPWGISVVGTLWWLLRQHFRDNPEDTRELRQYLPVVMVQVVLTMVYPAYTYVFLHLSTASQVAFATLMPIIKLTAKNAVAYALHGKDELKPEAVILNVEVFNALFMVCCMQGSTSIYATLVLMGADFLHACWSLRDIKVMLNQISDVALPGQCLAQGEFWLDQAIFLCERNPSFADRMIPSGATRHLGRVHPSIELRPSSVFEPVHNLVANPTQLQVIQQTYSNKPASALDPRLECAIAEVTALSPLQKKQFVLQTLRILYRLEFVLLIEFTETIVPIIYSVFVSMALHLPNHEYYSQFIGATADGVVHQLNNVLTYSALELASLVALQVMLRCYVKLSPLHLLAFVLEKQINMVQSHLIAWFQVSINMMLFHFGEDS
ncbi:TPA: hypothetical protein N0F65_006182 [Lagenidium giganteum]|uniref:Uncharacterized protein n=1 Tax=Lagenidium giganteum TaxID=4803 RepID=A0AAV2ZA62_9STRA|nr:TPA: hypothetical protein N0F65_006182 [Lagenidium giganteum]